MREHMDQVVLATARPRSLGSGLFIAYTVIRESGDYAGVDRLVVVGARVMVRRTCCPCPPGCGYALHRCDG